MANFQVDEQILNGVHNFTMEENYVTPSPEIQEKLEWFRDQKLALMVHMGLYCEFGTVASWGLSDHDANWSRKDVEWAKDGDEYRKIYFNLNKSFNPVRFNPEEWADLAKDNGFKYLIFTTKHHDGFCLWDTKETDYKTTSPECPYSVNQNSDIIKNVFEAFRDRGLGIAAYFSKPDWHSPFYWVAGMEHSNPTWRMTSYDPNEYPDLWEKFVKFTHNQMLELTTEYGQVDILWLDGGQVRPDTKLDIRLGEVVEKARKVNPKLIVADRTVGGEFENYVTPEQTVPEKPMDIPWESNITLGKCFTFNFDDSYKSVETVIRLLIDVVAKGGNLAINISPQPDGRMPSKAKEIMKGIGAWMNKYGEAIYKTRICAPYKVGNVAFTKNSENVFAFILTGIEEVHNEVIIPYTEKIENVLLMNTGEKVNFENCSQGIKVTLNDVTDNAALVFKMS